MQRSIEKINYWREVPNARQELIKNFTPQLFTLCMGTGVLGVLMRNNGYRFDGMGIISIILFIIDLVLFVPIFILFALRLILYWRSTVKVFTTDTEQTCYISAMSIALANIVQLVATICGARWAKWDIVSIALWWFTAMLTLITATITYWSVIRLQKVSVAGLPPTLMYPTAAMATTSAAGAVVISYTPLDVGPAQPALIAAYLLMGAGFFLCLLTLAAYLLRLIHNATPESRKIAGQLIPLAPLTNCALAFDSLGSSAGPTRQILQYYGKGKVSSEMVGAAIYATGFIFELIIWGFATFWLLFSAMAFIADLRKTRYTLNMWSGAFPLGAYGLCANQIAVSLDSPAFRVISTIVLIVLVIYWLVSMAFTIPLMITGQLFLQDAYDNMVKDREGDGLKRSGRDQQREERSSNGSESRQSDATAA